jgi:hypothetical protein
MTLNFNNPETYKNYITEELNKQLDNFTSGILKQILLESLGVEIDSWGRVHNISNEFANDIFSRVDPNKIEKFKNRISSKIDERINDKLLNKEKMNSIVYKMMQKYENEVLQEIITEIEEDHKNQIKQKLRAEMSAWINESIIKKI